MGFIYLYIFEEFATAALTREAGANRERDGSIKASQLVRVGQSGTARAGSGQGFNFKFETDFNQHDPSLPDLFLQRFHYYL